MLYATATNIVATNKVAKVALNKSAFFILILVLVLLMVQR